MGASTDVGGMGLHTALPIGWVSRCVPASTNSPIGRVHRRFGNGARPHARRINADVLLALPRRPRLICVEGRWCNGDDPAALRGGWAIGRAGIVRGRVGGVFRAYAVGCCVGAVVVGCSTQHRLSKRCWGERTTTTAREADLRGGVFTLPLGTRLGGLVCCGAPLYKALALCGARGTEGLDGQQPGQLSCGSHADQLSGGLAAGSEANPVGDRPRCLVPCGFGVTKGSGDAPKE